MINWLQQNRRSAECPVMLLLLLLLLLLMLLLLMVVLMMMGVAVSNDARASAGEIAGLLGTEEMSYQPRGDRCCRRIVDAVYQGRGQGHRTTRDERVRMKIRGDGGNTCLVSADDRLGEPGLARG